MAAKEGEGMKEKIFRVLTAATEPLKKADVAHRVGQTSGKDVNKYLYELEKEGRAVQVNKSPPLWKIAGESSQTNSSAAAPSVLISLETPIRDLPYSFQEAANLLRIGPSFPANWKTFAGHLDYSLADVAMFEERENPPWEVIKDWSTKAKATLRRFIDILAEMDRADVLTKLCEKLSEKMSPDAKSYLEEKLKSSPEVLNGENPNQD